MNTIIYTVIVSFIVAFVLGFLLGVFKKVFAVEVNPLTVKIRAALPGVNCGACGFPGCDGFAAACADGKAPPNGCKPGAAKSAEAIKAILAEAATK